jgi:hypothetical protein
MPDLTIVIWNVETFGDTKDALRGATYTPMCNFIAQMLHACDADVFIMMEFRSGGVNYLPTLRNALNAVDNVVTWDYDWVPGSVLRDHHQVHNFNDLGYTQEGHSEGYAVFWKADAKYTMMTTRLPLSGNSTYNNPVEPSKIGLVFNGRGPTPDPNIIGQYQLTNGWYTAPNFNPAMPPLAWSDLNFPVPNPIRLGDIRFDVSRRPCYCLLSLNIMGANRSNQLLPIVVFHAPRNARSTSLATQLCGFSEPLYQADDTALGVVTLTNTNQALVAGDFNIDFNDLVNPDQTAYTVFTNTYASLFGGGANCTNSWIRFLPPNTDENQTAVRLEAHNVPINTNDPMDYRWLAIDRLYYRNANPNLTATVPANPYNGPAYDLISAVMGDGVNFGSLVDTMAKRNVIRSFRAPIINALGIGNANYPYVDPVTGTPCRSRKRQRDEDVFSGPVIPNLISYNAYARGLNRGYFTTARTAAEFIFNSISDHLPMVIRFNY